MTNYPNDKRFLPKASFLVTEFAFFFFQSIFRNKRPKCIFRKVYQRENIIKQRKVKLALGKGK